MRISFLPMLLGISSGPTCLMSLMTSAFFIAQPSQAISVGKAPQQVISEEPAGFSIITILNNAKLDFALGIRAKRFKNKFDISDSLDMKTAEFSFPKLAQIENLDNGFAPMPYLSSATIRRSTRSADGNVQEKAMEAGTNAAGMAQKGFGVGENGAKAGKNMADGAKSAAEVGAKGAETMGSGAEMVQAGMKQGQEMASG